MDELSSLASPGSASLSPAPASPCASASSPLRSQSSTASFPTFSFCLAASARAAFSCTRLASQVEPLADPMRAPPRVLVSQPGACLPLEAPLAAPEVAGGSASGLASPRALRPGLPWPGSGTWPSPPGTGRGQGARAREAAKREGAAQSHGEPAAAGCRAASIARAESAGPLRADHSLQNPQTQAQVEKDTGLGASARRGGAVTARGLQRGQGPKPGSRTGRASAQRL